MLLFVYTATRKRFVIFTCRYFKLSWNTTTLSQSNCRNISYSSINYREKHCQFPWSPNPNYAWIIIVRVRRQRKMWIHVKLGWNQLNFELTVLLCTLCGSQEWDLQVFWNHSGPCAVTRSSCVSHVCFLEIRYNFLGLVGFLIAWENSLHFAIPLLVSPQNDVWEMSAEIPYWWRVTTQNWIVLLIGWSKFPTWHNQSETSPRSG